MASANHLESSTMEPAKGNIMADHEEKGLKDKGGLSLVEQSLTHIPESVGLSKGLVCLELNLKSNRVVSLAALKYFKSLQVLILDDNALIALPDDCPTIPSVKTLWANKNLISDLDGFLRSLRSCFPCLEHLSIMQNPASPTLRIPQASREEMQKYMRKVAQAMQHVDTLDYMRICRESRASDKVAVKSRGAPARPTRDALHPLSSNAANLMRRGGKLLKGGVESRAVVESSEGNRFIRDDSL